MSLRVLFVDDEPNVLDGLRRSLRGFRREWEMSFADGGRAALASLEANPTDVVVSDMRMPGLEGDALLAEVRERWPQTVRIVLTGDCTRESMLRVTTLAHRILVKPCDPEELRAAVSQASGLMEILNSPQLAAAVGGLKSVPSKPDLYTRILAVLDDPDSSIADLGRVCGRDVGASAKLIQVANSAMFGGKHPATDSVAAVQRIGADLTKALVLADGVLTQFDPRSIHPYSVDDLWTHSHAVAELSTRIAQMEAGDAGWLNLVSSAGILHDIGRLIFAATEPRRYVAVLQQVERGQIPLTVAERQEFGATHAEIGAYLLGLCGLPTAIVEAVAWHHTPYPTPCPVDRLSLVTVLHAADAILAPRESGGPDLEHLNCLGLADRVPAWAALAEERK